MNEFDWEECKLSLVSYKQACRKFASADIFNLNYNTQLTKYILDKLKRLTIYNMYVVVNV